MVGAGWGMQFFYGEAGDGNFCSHSEEQQPDIYRSSAAVANAQHHDSEYTERTCHMYVLNMNCT
jgi:hypothetical protein